MRYVNGKSYAKFMFERIILSLKVLKKSTIPHVASLYFKLIDLIIARFVETEIRAGETACKSSC